MEHLVKISSTGDQLPIDAKEWVAVLDLETNLMWSRYESDIRMPHAACEEYVAAGSVAGFKDCHFASRKEQLSIVDDTRHDPAIDTRFFDSYGEWVWTSTRASWARERVAWVVGFYGGDSGYNNRGGEARVRLVRSVAPASASQ